jgi:putative two-component system hydrogenase maturation factor HypX/HoxX
VGPRGSEAFAGWLHEVAAEQGKGWQWRSTLDCKAERARRAAKPLSYYETRELAEMAGDMFDDRKGFAAARRAFMYKEKPTGRPRSWRCTARSRWPASPRAARKLSLIMRLRASTG